MSEGRQGLTIEKIGKAIKALLLTGDAGGQLVVSILRAMMWVDLRAGTGAVSLGKITYADYGVAHEGIEDYHVCLVPEHLVDAGNAGGGGAA